MARLDVAEKGDLAPEFRSQFHLCAADYDVRMDTGLLEHLDGVLRRLCLEFLRRAQVRYQSQVYADEILVRQLPLKLTDRLHERLGLHISHCATHFRDNYIELSGLAEEQHPALDLVCDMRYNLYCLPKIGSFPLLVDDRPVDLSGRHIVGLGHMHAQKPLIMTEIQIGLGTVVRHVALSVLVRIQSSRIDVDVGIEFLDGDPKSSGLKKFGQRCGNDTFSQRGSHTASNENILCTHILFCTLLDYKFMSKK